MNALLPLYTKHRGGEVSPQCPILSTDVYAMPEHALSAEHFAWHSSKVASQDSVNSTFPELKATRSVLKDGADLSNPLGNETVAVVRQ